MDSNALAVLIADVEAQMSLIEATSARLEERAADLTPDDDPRLESVAYQIHNLYNAVEDLLKIVAAHFENQIADAASWHTALLYRMTQAIPDVRPPLLSEDSYRVLNGLRGFRHFFRHAYAAPIEYDQLRLNLDRARQLRQRLREDVDRFLRELRASAPSG